MSNAGVWQQLLARWESGPGPRIAADGAVLDAAALADRVARATGWWQSRGAGPGDRVVIQLPRSVAALELVLGAMAGGMVAVPVHARATASELAWLIDDARPAAVASAPPDLAASAPAAFPGPTGDDPACILYTSGTTGRPKGAVILHRNVIAGLASLHAAWGWSSDDVLVHALPLDHVHGLFVAQLGALWAGATTSFLPRFDADAVWDAFEAGATLFMGVPTFYHRLLASPRTPHLPRARLFTCGSAPLPASVLLAFERRYGHRILERYGMTEVGIVASNPLHGDRRPGSIGLPLPGAAIRVVDPSGAALPPGEVGELRVRGPTVFAGYLGRPRESAEALEGGEMHTGDLGFFDNDGYLVLTGRASELILVGGNNVYPREVEAALLHDPNVAEAAVVGAVDADLGEVPVAILVARPGAERDTAGVLARARERLSPFKVPRRARWVDALPRNAMGKPIRSELLRLAAPIAVRPARPDEAQAIADRNVAMAHETESLALDPSTALAGATTVLSRDVGASYLVAESGGRTVGQLMITREWSDWRNAPVWWIQSVYVDPDQRGHGVYRALYDAVLRAAEEAGVAAVRLYVDQRNASAMAVYRRLGMDGEHYRVFEQLLPR